MMGALERAVRAQREWIAACDDVEALSEKMAEWREDVRVATREGQTLLRLRAGDLVELAEDRIVELKAAKLRVPRARVAAPAPVRESVEAAEVRRLREELAARDKRDEEEKERQANTRRADEKRERVARDERDGQKRVADERERAQRAPAEERACRNFCVPDTWGSDRVIT